MTNRSFDEVKARFDRVAAGWDSNPGRIELAKAVAGAMRQAVPLRPDMEVMDFGAGTGLLTLALLPDVGRLTSVDASGEMLRVLDGKLQALGIRNVRTLQGDIARQALPAGAFDLVASAMVLHHLPDVPPVLARLRACLKPGGWIALADLDSEDGSFHADATGVYHHGFDRAEVRRWLQAAGFTDTATREAHRVKRPGTDGQLREYPVFLATGRGE